VRIVAYKLIAYLLSYLSSTRVETAVRNVVSGKTRVNRQLNRLIFVSSYWVMTIEFVLAELPCCDSERVFCNYL